MTFLKKRRRNASPFPVCTHYYAGFGEDVMINAIAVRMKDEDVKLNAVVAWIRCKDVTLFLRKCYFEVKM